MDGRHHHLAIMTENWAFKNEDWPYHPKIAGVYHGLGHADRETAQATARLIAAAPDLLASLKALTDALDYGAIKNCQGIWKNALDVILKAEGRNK